MFYLQIGPTNVSLYSFVNLSLVIFKVSKLAIRLCTFTLYSKSLPTGQKLQKYLQVAFACSGFMQKPIVLLSTSHSSILSWQSNETNTYIDSTWKQKVIGFNGWRIFQLYVHRERHLSSYYRIKKVHKCKHINFNW